MTAEELRQKIAPLNTGPVIADDDTHAHTEWESRNEIRFCKIFTLKDGGIRASVAICKPNQHEDVVLREAYARLDQ